MSDLPLPPPEGDTSDEVVGNGSQPFRRVDEAVGRGPRARRFSFRTVRGTVPTTGDSLHRKHVIAVVGTGSQPFRRVDEQRATSDLPLPPPEGDTSNEAVGNGSQPFRRAALRQAQGDLPLHPRQRGTRAMRL